MLTLDGHVTMAIVDTGSKYTVMSRRAYNALDIEAPLEDRLLFQHGRGATRALLPLTHGFAAFMTAGEEPHLFTCTLHVRVTAPSAQVGFDFVLGNDFLRIYALNTPVSDSIALKQISPPEATSPPAKRRLFG